MGRRIGAGLLGLVVLAVGVFVGAGRGCFGDHEGPGAVTRAPIPRALVDAHASVQAEAAWDMGVRPDKQILFGDFHVHTTFSPDAFFLSLPVVQGEGAHPPADACDYARYCSGLDFWSINDHAEGITPQHWRETVESIRQCNDVAGDAANPDVVAFLGWEWTQVGRTPDSHYGHKNVVLAHTDDGRIPARPIASRSFTSRVLSPPPFGQRALVALFGGDPRYHDFARYQQELSALVPCEDGVDVRALPEDCLESTVTPVGPRRHRDSPRHDLGLLYAARLHLGQAAQRRRARSGPSDPRRDPFGPRQLGGVPELAGRARRRGRSARVPRAHPGLPPVLLAGRGDHPIALRQRGWARARM
jgi:hypothetical protein